MEPLSPLSTIAHNIELAVAPVFLIAGIGALLNVLTTRLARAVDRARTLEATLATSPDDGARERIRKELKAAGQRMTCIHVAVTLCTLAALLVCLVIMLLFAGELWHANLARIIAALFIATMAALIVGLCFFLAEISIATRVLRVRTDVIPSR